MGKSDICKAIILLSFVFILIGCGSPYVITQDLEFIIDPATSCSIGVITDALPADIDEANKPTLENIEVFKLKMAEFLVKEDVFAVVRPDLIETEYEITGSILDYTRGSGFLRFMFGFGAGAATLTVALEVTDINSNEVIFSGNFKGSVTSWLEEGDKTFEFVAKNFTKALKKQLKKLAEEQEKQR